MEYDQIQRITKWAAAECKRQRSGELSVGWMVDAWVHAWVFRNKPIAVEDVLALGRLVEPEKNDRGYRRVGVTIGGYKPIGSPIDSIGRHVEALLDIQTESDPDEFYIAFEEIHPFVDGNGRVGNILWNWVREALADPGVPPDFWADENEQAYREHLNALVASKLWGDEWQPYESQS